MGNLPFGDMSASDPKRTFHCRSTNFARNGNRRGSRDWQVEGNYALRLTLNFDHFCVVFVRIYDRNDYDRISLLNRRAGGFRRFFAAE